MRRTLAARGKSRAALLSLVLLLTAAVAEGQRIMLVHLPSAPVEAANRQAEAITSLAEYLQQRLPEQQLEPKIFRRWRDADAFLRESPEQVALIVSDASFVLDAPSGIEPAYRFVRNDRQTYRRILVVRSDRPELEKLVDLRGGSLAVVETAGAIRDAAFLEHQVFGDELEPTAWFDTLDPAADDFEAAASVLYGQTDAALIAEYNPLLASHLGQELRAVFESPELSLPVLSVRPAAFGPEEREALGQALGDLGGDPLGQKVLTELGIEGLSPVAGAALTRAAERREKTLVIAAPVGVAVDLQPPPLPPAGHLSFGVAVELPEIPVRVEKVEPR